MNEFLDGLIYTLNEDFGEKSISLNSTQNEKILFLRKLYNELDHEYKDEKKFYEII
jgi:hypothetical protein